MTQAKVIICPYCGETQPAGERCRSCGGLFEPLSRQATHNAMGPWFVRDPGKPFQPGCSYETLVRMIDRGQITKYSIIRGPTTRQFWTVAKHVAGVAHLLGYCHNCDASVDPGDHGCHVCGQPFGAYLDRNYLGLPDVRPLPWEAEIEGGAAISGGMAGIGSGSGLSRFASDEELLQHGPMGGGAGSGGAAGSGGTATQPALRVQPRTAMEMEPDPAPDTAFDDYASSPMARSLRRKLAGQQRLVNVLAVTIVLITMLSVITNLDEIGALFAGDEQVTPTTAQEPTARARTPVPADEPAPADDAPAAPPEPEPATVTESKPAEPPAAIDPVAAAWQEAVVLIASGQSADRPLAARIRDYEKAVEKLQFLVATVSADRQPVGIGKTIENAERELEKLRLERDFYGGGASRS